MNRLKIVLLNTSKGDRTPTSLIFRGPWWNFRIRQQQPERFSPRPAHFAGILLLFHGIVPSR